MISLVSVVRQKMVGLRYGAMILVVEPVFEGQLDGWQTAGGETEARVLKFDAFFIGSILRYAGVSQR